MTIAPAQHERVAGASTAFAEGQARLSPADLAEAADLPALADLITAGMSATTG